MAPAVTKIVLTVLMLWASVACEKPNCRDNEVAAFLQKKSNTCGAAAVAYFLSLKSIAADQDKIERLFPVISHEGYSMYDLSKIAVYYGVDVEGIRCSVDELSTIETPFICLLEHEKHFIVIIGIASDSITYFDPVRGMTGCDKTSFSENNAKIKLLKTVRNRH